MMKMLLNQSSFVPAARKPLPGLPPRIEAPHHPRSQGFTLTELLVIIAVVAVLMACQLSASSGSKPKSKGAQCLNNVRQLSLAWLMYAEDNHDYILASADDGNGTLPYQPINPSNYNRGNNYAWTWSKMDFSGSNPYNTDPAADIMLRPMWKYIQNASAYKCPGDPSTVSVNGASVPRVRSYSMNWFLGGFGENSSDPIDASFTFYTRLTDLADPVRSPGTAHTFLFIEEREDAINWGDFEPDMTGYPVGSSRAAPAAYEWNEDLPGAYHDRAGGISFCDGHAELHKWLDASTLPRLAGEFLSGGKGDGSTFTAPYSVDVAWLQNATVRSH